MLTAQLCHAQAEHQYTLKELASVKAALHRRNNYLHDLESRLQDQESAACEYGPSTSTAVLNLSTAVLHLPMLHKGVCHQSTGFPGLLRHCVSHILHSPVWVDHVCLHSRARLTL